jgi:serine/threonine-protein kinase
VANTPEQWSQVERLFHRAEELPPAERAAFIDAQSVDVEIRQTVHRLLQGDAMPLTLLDDGIAEPAATLLALHDRGQLPTETFGPYRAIGILGEGGMGVVYLAERADIGARVAVKVLWDAPLSPNRRARFDEEQRILTRLQHPAIVPLYHAGETESRAAWFAMEYVDGIPITDHCYAADLSIRQRLALLREVCVAVRAAHTRLVVHGDLKPSNILVDREGRVRLLDFGVASRLDSDAPRMTGRLLTPAYSAPERHADDSVSVQADVYSLGILLFELIAGRRPSSATEPPSAASRLRSEAANTREDWEELDALTGRAMAESVSDRLVSVEALERDLERYLDGRALDVMGGGAWYRARKTVRRQRTPLIAALALLVLTATGLLYHDRSLRQARDAALAEASRTARLKIFLENLFEGGGQSPQAIDSIRVATIVTNGIREARALTTDRAAQVDLLESLGIVAERLGQFARADTLVEEAIRGAVTLYGAENPRTLRARVRRAKLMTLRAQMDSAERELRLVNAAAAAVSTEHPVRAETELALGMLLRSTGRSTDGVPYVTRAVAYRAAVDTLSREYVEALRELGNSLATSGNLAGADSVWGRALPIARHVFGPSHPEVAFLLANIGNTASQRGDLADAERYQRESVAALTAWFGRDYYLTAVATMVLAQTLNRADKAGEAKPMLERVIDVYSRTKDLGPDHAETAIAIGTLGNALQKLGEHRAARERFERSVALLRGSQGPDSKNALIQEANVASTWIPEGRADTATAMLRRLVQRSAARLGDRNMVTAQLRIRLGTALVAAKEYREVIRTSSEALVVLDSVMGGIKPSSKPGREDLLTAFVAVGDSAGARRMRAELATLARPAGR